MSSGSGTSALCAVLTASLLLSACGQEPPEIVRQISVTGNGTAEADPDVAPIIFGVDVSSDDPGEAVAAATTMMNSAVEAAGTAGVSAEDISTQSYSLWIENVYDPVTYQYTGEKLYHVSHYETAEVRDLATVGDVLAALVDAGVNSISSVTFRVEDQSALFAQAREAAMADALNRAEAIAEGLGVSLGEPTYVSEYGGGYTEFDHLGRAGDITTASAGMVESGPYFSPGSFSTTASVTVTFEME